MKTRYSHEHNKTSPYFLPPPQAERWPFKTDAYLMLHTVYICFISKKFFLKKINIIGWKNMVHFKNQRIIIKMYLTSLNINTFVKLILCNEIKNKNNNFCQNACF